MSNPDRPYVPSPSIATASSSETLSGTAILVAEDDQLMQHMIERCLRDDGYLVDCVENGEAAWKLINKKDYALLITDHDMPLLTGLDLLRRLRSSPFKLPAIIISGRMPVDTPDFNQLIDRGAALAKPFSIDELMTIIQTVLFSQMKRPN